MFKLFNLLFYKYESLGKIFHSHRNDASVLMISTATSLLLCDIVLVLSIFRIDWEHSEFVLLAAFFIIYELFDGYYFRHNRNKNIMQNEEYKNMRFGTLIAVLYMIVPFALMIVLGVIKSKIR